MVNNRSDNHSGAFIRNQSFFIVDSQVISTLRGGKKPGCRGIALPRSSNLNLTSCFQVHNYNEMFKVLFGFALCNDRRPRVKWLSMGRLCMGRFDTRRDGKGRNERGRIETSPSV